jgi:beta-glucosidase-like glycosyl hydrolase
MCAYNAVNGVPQCADEFMIDTVLRGHWNWTADENYIVTDCTSVQNIFTDHFYADTRQQTVAAAISSGADLECGYYFPTFLESTVQQGLLDEADVDRSLLRMYTALTKSGRTTRGVRSAGKMSPPPKQRLLRSGVPKRVLYFSRTMVPSLSPYLRIATTPSSCPAGGSTPHPNSKAYTRVLHEPSSLHGWH